MTEIDADLQKFRSRILQCESDIAYALGKINKRLAGIKRQEDTEEEEKAPSMAPGLVPLGKDLNSRLGI
jgi:hypothetical protein